MSFATFHCWHGAFFYAKSHSSCPCTNTLITLPSTPITIGIIVTFSSKVLVLISLFVFFQFYPVVSRNGRYYYNPFTPLRVFHTSVILVDLNDDVICIISLLNLIFISPNLLYMLLETVSSALTTLDITVIFMSHSSSRSLARSKHLSFFPIFFPISSPQDHMKIFFLLN